MLRLGLQDVVHGEAHLLPDAPAPGLGEGNVGRDHVAEGGQPSDLRLEEAVERRVDRHAHGVVFLGLDPLLFGFFVRILLPGPGVPGLRADLQPAHELLRRAQVERIGEGAYGCLPVVVPGIRAGIGRVPVEPNVVPAVPQRVVEAEHDGMVPARRDLRAGPAEVRHAAAPGLPAGRLDDGPRGEPEPERGGGPARLAGPAARRCAQVEAVPAEPLVDGEAGPRRGPQLPGVRPPRRRMQVPERLGEVGLSAHRQAGDHFLPVPAGHVPAGRLPAEPGLPRAARRAPDPAVLPVLDPLFQQEPGLGLDVPGDFHVEELVRRPVVAQVAQVPAFLHAAAVVRHRKPGLPAALHREDVHGQVDHRDAQDVARHVPDDRLVLGDDLCLVDLEVVVQVVRVVAGGVGAVLEFEGPVGVEPHDLAVEEPLLVLGAAVPDLPLARLHVVLHAVPDHDVRGVLQPGIGVGLGIDVRRRGQEVRRQQLGVGVEPQAPGRQPDVAVLQLGVLGHHQGAVAEHVLDVVRIVLDHRQVGRIGLGAGRARSCAHACARAQAQAGELREGRPGQEEQRAQEADGGQQAGRTERNFTFFAMIVNNVPRPAELC